MPRIRVKPLRQSNYAKRLRASNAARILMGDPPHSPTELFEALAAETWLRVLAGEMLDTQQSEETLTDNNLLSFALAGLPNIRVYKAQGNEESTKGFDWEWWIGKPGSWWRYSVQAKRLYLSSGTYKYLRHKVGSADQIDILDDFAKSQRSIPLYCFYNWTTEVVGAAGWNCNLEFDEEQLGCTLLPLEYVRPLYAPYKAKTFQAVHANKKALPWRCLVGCPYVLASYKRGDFHPLAPSGHSPLLYESLPSALIRNFREPSVDAIELERSLYASDLGGYPERIAVIDVSDQR